jgi:hypothetical protein
LAAVRTHPFLLINPRSGGRSPSADELAAAARERGVEPHLLRPGEDPRELALRSGAETVGIAGGDGSLAPVAAAALPTNRTRASISSPSTRYELDLFTLGVRGQLDGGTLDIWAAAGWWPTTWEERVAPSFRIELPVAQAAVAIDGEPARLEPPLELGSLPGALRLLVPGRTAEGTTIGGAMHDNPRATESEE